LQIEETGGIRRMTIAKTMGRRNFSRSKPGSEKRKAKQLRRVSLFVTVGDKVVYSCGWLESL